MSQANILLIDDRAENLLTLEAVLEQYDYHLVRCEGHLAYPGGDGKVIHT